MENAIAVKEDTITATDVKKYIAQNATDKELYMFMGICKSYGLNPLKREIHFVKYGNAAASIIVGYEIYLKRAERTGKLDGWKRWIEKDNIGEKAIIEIKRKDQSIPIRWEVYRSEFDKQQSTWKAMPTFMLKKVAIAQGFRLAFPDDLGGMPYIPEELPATSNNVTSETLEQKEVDNTIHAKIPEVAAPEVADIPFITRYNQGTDSSSLISEAQQKRLFAISTSSGWKPMEVKTFLQERFGIEKSAEIPREKYQGICEYIEANKKAA